MVRYFDAYSRKHTERTMALDPQTGDIFLVTAKLIENPHPSSYRDRYTAVPGSFELLVFKRSATEAASRRRRSGSSICSIPR